MSDLEFDVQVGWAGTGREGLGRIDTDDLVLELSTPASMGGRGVGTNPEELLVSAVAAYRRRWSTCCNAPGSQ